MNQTVSHTEAVEMLDGTLVECLAKWYRIRYNAVLRTGNTDLLDLPESQTDPIWKAIEAWQEARLHVTLAAGTAPGEAAKQLDAALDQVIDDALDVVTAQVQAEADGFGV